jgi:uncharacterized membrane protein HdeD (DUF308 family)
MTSSGAHAQTSPLPGPLAARGARRITLAVGAVMVTLGMLLFFWPYASLAVTAVLLGIALLATGVLRLVHGVMAGGAVGAHRSAHLLIGILAVLAGIYCLGDIAGTVILLSLVVGLFWVMHGLVDLVAAGRPGPGRVLTGITGGLSLVAGLTVIFWPAITVPVMVAVMGAWLACDGLLLVVTLLYLRHAARAAAAARLAAGLPMPSASVIRSAGRPGRTGNGPQFGIEGRQRCASPARMPRGSHLPRAVAAVVPG